MSTDAPTANAAEPSLGDLWDSTSSRIAAAAVYVVAVVYGSGATVIAGRLYRRGVPLTATIGQLPRSYVLTVGAEVMLPVALPRLMLATTWGTLRARPLRQLLVPCMLASAASAAAIGVSNNWYRRKVYHSELQQLLVVAAIAAVVLWLLIEIRNRAIDWAKPADGNCGSLSAKQYLIGSLTTLPVVLTLAIVVGSGFPFPSVQFCGPGFGTRQGNLIAQDSDTVYILQTNQDIPHTPAWLQILPRSSLSAVTIDGPCPSNQSG